jgi:CDP-4-dehydro-6-deoxyglucose reductase, E3
MHSCRNGSCGSCKALLVSGEVDYGQYEEKALSAAERAAGKVLLCQAIARSDLVVDATEVIAAEGVTIRILPCRVVGMMRLAHDVMQLKLKLPENHEFNYLPGQYLEFLLRDGKRRSFSMAAPPVKGKPLELHIRQVPGGFFTGHVFTQMKEKDLLRFQGPLGTFFLREESARPIILMAGGTGFAPIKAIIMHALAQGLRRPMHLYWGVRARRDLYMDDLARQWADAHDQLSYTPVLSEPNPEDRWIGRTGWVHEAVIADHPDLSNFEVYASGPPPMIEAARPLFAAHGLPGERLYFDSFEFAHAP